MAKKVHAAVRRKGQHLTEQDRYDIERLLKQGWSKKQIAEALGCCLATVYNEIKRGQYDHTVKGNYKEVKKYSAEYSWNKYTKELKKKGTVPKLILDPKLVDVLKELLTKEKYSPEAALHVINSSEYSYKVKITSKNTIYAAIKRGLIKGVNLVDLPDCGYHRMKKSSEEGKKNKTHKRKIKGDSIENRPAEVATRDIFGHWEMDTVKGKQKNKKCILVLTERKTRFEIMEILKSNTTAEVCKAMNRIEKRYGASFYTIFKTITVDNGAEFQDCEGMQKALNRVGNRTKIYYCHPYTSCERGSNENINRMIRRWWRKGMDFDSRLERNRLKRSEAWLNDYPRKKLGGKTSRQCFINEIKNEKVSIHLKKIFEL